jgi:hypothetical protein
MVLLVLAALSNVVGYQSKKSPAMSNSPLFRLKLQKMLNNEQNSVKNRYLGERTNSENDTIPPITICILDPPEPNGNNGWYISKINVTLIATDDNSGVNRTEYQLDGGAWQTYKHPFNITVDGHRILNYRSIDNAGNREQAKNVTFSIDKTRPLMALNYTVTEKYWNGYVIVFNFVATDKTSGMNRTEFFLNDELQETIFGSGPYYQYQYLMYYTDRCNVRGFIRNREITDDSVKFYSLVVFVSVIGKYFPHFSQKFYAYDNAGNWDWETIETPTFRTAMKPGLYLFQNMTLPNNYTGYIGKFIVRATFYGTIEGNQ